MQGQGDSSWSALVGCDRSCADEWVVVNRQSLLTLHLRAGSLDIPQALIRLYQALDTLNLESRHGERQDFVKANASSNT